MDEKLGDSALIEAWFQVSSIGVALLDRELRFGRVNQTLATLTEVSIEDHLGKELHELAPVMAPTLRVWMREALETQRPVLGRHIVGVRRITLVLDIIPVSAGLLVVVVDHTALDEAQRIKDTRLQLSRLIGEISAGFIDLPAAEIASGVAAALRVTGEVLAVDRGYVALFSADRTLVELVYSWEREPSARTLRKQYALSNFPNSLALLLDGRDFFYGSNSTLSAAVKKEAASFAARPAQATMMMPLRIGRDVVGFVGFADMRNEREWTSDHLTSMRITVEIIASALDRKRQDDELRDRLAFDALVARLSRDFMTASISTLEALVPRTLAAIGEALHFDRAAIYRFDPKDRGLSFWHEWLSPGTGSLRPKFERVERAEIGHVPPEFYKGEAIVMYADALPAEAILTKRVMADGMQIAAMTPLMSAGQNFGTLALHGKTKIALPSDFRSRLSLVGEVFASTIARMEAERAREAAYQELAALKSQIERERDYLREEIRSETHSGAIIGLSATMRDTLEAISAVAGTNATVLIRGESGVGKELFARAIHELSARKDGPLVKVNCAAVPRELFESEFFGHIRGAFTGAHKDRAGRFELADGGTLFLDEVGDIPLDLQAKLLRVLQEGEYERIGDEHTHKTNVRLVAATNRDLEADIAAGRFRSDLYYRLCTFPIEVPPLRSRSRDVILLAQHFLSIYARDAGKRGLMILPEHEQLLLAYSWPGNVRELQHVIERAVILSSGERLRLDLALPKSSVTYKPAPPQSTISTPPATLPAPAASAPSPSAMSQPVPMTEFKRLERDNILFALEKTHWRIAGTGGAAELLGLKPSTLRDRMRVLGLDRQR